VRHEAAKLFGKYQGDAMPEPAGLTERQEKWFASVRDGLERETGKTLAAWVELARLCPETAHRKRLAWMKAEHGLGQNRASMVLNAAFPPDSGWSTPDVLADNLWTDAISRAIHEKLRAVVLALPEVVVGQRKQFTAYSRKFQFCAARPARQGVILGLSVDPLTDPALQPRGREPWSERLLSSLPLGSPEDLTEKVIGYIKDGWERS